MPRSLLIALAVVIFMPLTAQAQQWTAAQQEVWEFEETCWATQDLEALMACFHDDFLGWGVGYPVPTSKADRRPRFARDLETEDIVYLNLKPLDVRVLDNVAIVLYLATYTSKNKATGKETTVTERWTDICLKEDNRWTWIADDGGLISNN